MPAVTLSEPLKLTGRCHAGTPPAQGPDLVNVAAALGIHLTPAEGDALSRLLPALLTVVNNTERGSVYVLNHEGRGHSAVVVMPGYEPTVITAPDTEHLLSWTRQQLTQTLLGTSVRGSRTYLPARDQMGLPGTL